MLAKRIRAFYLHEEQESDVYVPRPDAACEEGEDSPFVVPAKVVRPKSYPSCRQQDGSCQPTPVVSRAERLGKSGTRVIPSQRTSEGAPAKLGKK